MPRSDVTLKDSVKKYILEIQIIYILLFFKIIDKFILLRLKKISKNSVHTIGQIREWQLLKTVIYFISPLSD